MARVKKEGWWLAFRPMPPERLIGPEEMPYYKKAQKVGVICLVCSFIFMIISAIQKWF